MICTPSELVRLAKCYCFPKKTARAVWTYLLCRWATDFQWTPVAQNVDWNDPGGHTGNLANFNATANKAATTLIQFDGHAVETISYFGEGNLPVLATFTSVACNSLTSINSPDLVSITTFDANLCTALTTLDVGALTTVGGNFNADNCPALTTLDVGALTTVGGNFDASDCLALTTLDVGALTTMGSNFDTSGCSSLTTLDVSVLTTVGGNFDAHNCLALTTLNVPVLTTVGNNFYPFDCPTLTTLNVPVLTTVTNDFDASGCTLLSSVLCGSWVPTDGENINFLNCALTATSVELILRRCVLAGVIACTIDLSGGTSAGTASLSAQGQADVVTLGAQLTINP
jgi:hypothetical protein